MEIKIFDYGMNAEGVGKVDGKVVLIPFALCGEIVDADITTNNKNYSIAELKSVKNKSISRTAPPCPYYYQCGGCSLQHMTYNEQLEYKTLLVKKTLKKISNIDIDVNKCMACEQPYNYRNKVSFNYSNNASGFYKRNYKEIVSINNCLLADDIINKVYNLFNNYIYNTSDIKLVKHLVVRHINNQILVGVVTKQQIDLTSFYALLRKEFNNIGLYQIINTRNDSVVLSGKVLHIGGIKEIIINNFGLTYSVDLLGFHQTNIEIQNKIYNKVLEYITPNSKVVNGFSGQGLLSAIIATKANTVVGIELNKSSHISAEKLKKENKILNLKNINADFNKAIDNYLHNFDTIILDPAKKGCGEQVMHKINGITNIIYISCNPIALAKDLRILNNYTIEEVSTFDMFPNTNNVETVVKLKVKGN